MRAEKICISMNYPEDRILALDVSDTDTLDSALGCYGVESEEIERIAGWAQSGRPGSSWDTGDAGLKIWLAK